MGDLYCMVLSNSIPQESHCSAQPGMNPAVCMIIVPVIVIITAPPLETTPMDVC